MVANNIFDDIAHKSTIVYQMVTNNITCDGKYHVICCTGEKLARFATGCTSELKEQLVIGSWANSEESSLP